MQTSDCEIARHFIAYTCSNHFGSRLSVDRMNADKFIEQLNLRSSFVAAQVAAGVDVEAVREAQVRSLLISLNQIRALGIDDATRITAAMSDANHGWTQSQRSAVLRKLGDIVSANTSDAAADIATSRRNQTVVLENIFTENEWTQLQDMQIAFAEKERVVACRLQKNGITCPTVLALKQAAALLHCVCFADFPVDEEGMKRCAKKIKDIIKSLDKAASYTLQHIVAHPPDPRHLPLDVYRHAYGDESPVSKSLNRMYVVANEFKYRTFANRATPTLQLGQLGGPSASSTGSLAAVQDMFGPFLAQFAMQQMRMMPQFGTSPISSLSRELPQASIALPPRPLAAIADAPATQSLLRDITGTAGPSTLGEDNGEKDREGDGEDGAVLADMEKQM